eukprot:gb/GECG01013410.1/.p1 GENE.gb/GECG01013410.1/~~gb/GECG01013410.1/.p1  ORF type:complete len:129 (+),score=8.43 gb/GECG01013410.1/:1-387(+)
MMALGAPTAWGLTQQEAENALAILNQQTELSTAASLHKQDLEQIILAHQITETCVHAYTMNPTGLASEIFRFSDTDMSVCANMLFLSIPSVGIAILCARLCAGRPGIQALSPPSRDNRKSLYNVPRQW